MIGTVLAVIVGCISGRRGTVSMLGRVIHAVSRRLYGMGMPHRTGRIHHPDARVSLQANAETHQQNHEWTHAPHMV